MMMERYGIYVQDINYPTVPYGLERLRIAPTPHHTDEMKEFFVNSLVDVWEELGLEFVQGNVPEAACNRIVQDELIPLRA